MVISMYKFVTIEVKTYDSLSRSYVKASFMIEVEMKDTDKRTESFKGLVLRIRNRIQKRREEIIIV